MYSRPVFLLLFHSIQIEKNRTDLGAKVLDSSFVRISSATGSISETDFIGWGTILRLHTKLTNFFSVGYLIFFFVLFGLGNQKLEKQSIVFSH